MLGKCLGRIQNNECTNIKIQSTYNSPSCLPVTTCNLQAVRTHEPLHAFRNPFALEMMRFRELQNMFLYMRILNNMHNAICISLEHMVPQVHTKFALILWTWLESTQSNIVYIWAHTTTLHTWHGVSWFTSITIWYWHRIHTYNYGKNYQKGNDCLQDSLIFASEVAILKPTVCLFYYLSLNDPLADLLSSHGRRHPFKGDCSSKDDVESCFCLEEIEERQLKVLLSLVFSLVSYAWYFGSCCTAVILRASGKTQLKIEPMCTRNTISENSRKTKVVVFL